MDVGLDLLPNALCLPRCFKHLFFQNLKHVISCRADVLDHVMYRMGILAALRSKLKKGEKIIHESMNMLENRSKITLIYQYIFVNHATFFETNTHFRVQNTNRSTG